MRLFLALTPPAALRQRLGGLADRLHAERGGRRISDDNLHLTLAFLGEQDDTTASKLRRWVQRYPCAPGQLTLDHVGYFHRPGIVWIGPSSPPDSLLKLQSDLSCQLTLWGLPHQPQQFRPHVSLLRSAMTQSAQPLSEDYYCWPYTSIQLIQSSISHEGSRYTTLATSR
ncbi:RNA 2',3'-cyclic phosphodiesterase [Halomonas sp. DN3]|uniref:RNA 2',3'-cyclic phosphodiesterase n=1 Tax=Halomonas sp. DN3 TaxID=2953657 RepID=UPI0020A1B584|nr:RNA 2',3'-cyclic phosphodiesterase [Halomonas sp. DN3]USZ49881.1 RNA 2',3'-cyclic phosphodiesterase [Halomonas sp. DN3]